MSLWKIRNNVKFVQLNITKKKHNIISVRSVKLLPIPQDNHLGIGFLFSILFCSSVSLQTSIKETLV